VNARCLRQQFGDVANAATTTENYLQNKYARRYVMTLSHDKQDDEQFFLLLNSVETDSGDGISRANYNFETTALSERNEPKIARVAHRKSHRQLATPRRSAAPASYSRVLSTFFGDELPHVHRPSCSVESSKFITKLRYVS
jgi:hypothetical protein